MKNWLILICLFGCFSVSAQVKVPRDTSFTLHGTYLKEKKYHPYIQIAVPELEKGITVKKDVVYSNRNGRKLLLDVYYPAKNKSHKNYPGVLLIYGGGWRSGDKSQMEAMAKVFAANGYVAVAPEYRLSLEAIYPAAVYDLKASLRWMRENAKTINLDKSKIASLGTSAGGQLAALLGTTNLNAKYDGILKGSEESNTVQAIIDIDGTLAFHHPESSEGTAAAWWLGGTYAEKPEIWEDAAPLNHVDKNTPPIIFINSSNPRFHAGRNDMIKKLDSLKIYSEIKEFPDTPHPFWFFHPWFNPMMETAVNFLNKVFDQKQDGEIKEASKIKETQAVAGKLAEYMANTIIAKWPDSLTQQLGKPVKWSYDLGVIFQGMANIYQYHHDKKYITYMQHIMDLFVQPDGNINRYELESYNIDNVKNGSTLLFLYQQTGDKKYKLAAAHLRAQLKTHPRTSEGGFWHKKVYPHQMWLDGIYMGQPFYAQWSSMFNEPQNFDDIANQFILLDKRARDAKTGLLYHGWDEAKAQQWANKETGTSANFWGRAMGWYGMALVDVLSFFPKDHPQQKALLSILNNYAHAVDKVQGENGLWYQVLDKQQQAGNYPEASASCMFVYTIAKAVRLGYLPTTYKQVAIKGFEGIQKTFLEKGNDDLLHLNGTVQVSGLGGKPYRNGSYEYYLSEPIIKDDPKGMGAFILAASEMEQLN